MKKIPTVVASIARRSALSIEQSLGVEPVVNRDAVDALFIVRLAPQEPEKLMAVRFSGTVMAIRPEAFGLPSGGDRTTAMQAYAEAAIGDALDDDELPPLEGRGGTFRAIDCFSPHLQGWRDRLPAADERVEEYLSEHALAAWHFSQGSWTVGTADLLRLNRRLPDVIKLARLHEGERWTLSDETRDGITLSPLPAFVRDRRATTGAKAVAVTVPAEQPESAPPTFVYVDESRIADLRRLELSTFDLAKLIALCEELNICYRSQCYHAVAALTRALIDHVPPIFGSTSFGAVAAKGSRSFREAMTALDSMARKIADQHLHGQIRRTESLPTRTQVDYSQVVDVLLAEIVRTLRESGGSEPGRVA